MNTSANEIYTLDFVLNEVFSSPSFDWLPLEEIKFTICDSKCNPSETSKIYKYDGYNQIILLLKQYSFQRCNLEDYLIDNQLIPKPDGYTSNEGNWKMDYDYFMEDLNIKFPSPSDWDRGVENYPYKLNDFPLPNNAFRFARYQNTMGFYNWSSHAGSSGVAVPGGLVHTKPWINTQYPGESVYWMVDGQYSDSDLLKNWLGISYLKIRIIMEPYPVDDRKWAPIYEENYDNLTQEEAKALETNGITSYNFASEEKGWPQDGQYRVADKVIAGSNGDVPGDWNWGLRDHTSGSGQMYIVNADVNEKGLFYTHTIDICPGITARLSAWFLNLCDGTFSMNNNYYPQPGATAYDNRLYPIKPNIRMKVTAKVLEDKVQKEIVLANAYTGEIQFTTEWEKHFVEFEIPSNVVDNSIHVEFLNMYRGGQGNDFAIDDIKIEKLKCDLELDAPPSACYDREDFVIKLDEKSLYEFHKLKIYPDKIYFQWKKEKWYKDYYGAAQELHLGENAKNYAYDPNSPNPTIGVIDFDDYTQRVKAFDYTFTASGNGDVNPVDRTEKDRYILTIAGSPDELNGSVCSSSVSYILNKEEFDIDFIVYPSSKKICLGEKVEFQIVPKEGENILGNYDWYEWEIKGDHNWDIQELETQYELINPKFVGRSGPDGKITVYPQKTCVYRVEGFCENSQHVIVNVVPTPKIYFTENDDKYMNKETGVFTLRICSNGSSFVLPCYDTQPSVGSGQIEALYYEIYRVDDNKENTGACLKKGAIEEPGKPLGELPSALTQNDVNIGNHTEKFVIVLSLTEEPLEGECQSRIYFNVRNISDKAVWNPQPGNNDNWNYDGNWNVFSSNAIYDIHVLPYEAGVPMACTDVMIQGNSVWYPDLKSEEAYDDSKETGIVELPSDYNFSAQPVCNTIIFEMGGKLGNQHHLEYWKAFIEYNFGYYDINNNFVNGKPTSQIMRRDRFYTITIPLQDMVIGDFSFGGKPNAYSRYAEVIRDVETENMEANIEMTNPIPFYNVELKPGFGFAYKVLPYGDTEINNQKNLDRTRGVVRLPNFENEKDGLLVENYGQNHHNIWDKATSTNTFYYYLLGCPDHRLNMKKDTKYRCKWEKDENLFSAYRFISEKIYINRPDAGIVSIKSPKETAHILVGNPFFSYIHFNSFYEANRDLIYDYYYIYDGENILAYYPNRNISTQNGGDIYDDQINANGYIAPSQAFFVDPIHSGSEFNINLNANMTVVNPKIEEKLFLRSSPEEFNVLKVTAANSEYSSSIVIICHSSNSGDGVPKVFSDKTAIPEIYIKQGGKLKSIIEVGEIKGTIPLGIKTSRRNTNVTFSIQGLKDICNRNEVFFFDTELNVKKKLSVADSTYS
ncbi:MAG: hypothetical protein LIO93_10700, partial [Bacteroidales bacterium]|nr:hypothetical protein [Bacteroidales bacterium]